MLRRRRRGVPFRYDCTQNAMSVRLSRRLRRGTGSEPPLGDGLALTDDDGDTDGLGVGLTLLDGEGERLGDGLFEGLTDDDGETEALGLGLGLTDADGLLMISRTA
jgi:hypothetical protein